MPGNPKATKATIIPALRYRDAPAAIDWLCREFGFANQAVHAGEHGVIEHAQLTFGNGMIMLGSERDERHRRPATTSQPRHCGPTAFSIAAIRRGSVGSTSVAK